ncbi:PH domain-containing protein [Gordonia oryzae]|uniref:PH domain-containing protein n=2 Tax=Gordonia oryzae TaxID=2487349 RepID=A0A3N4GJA4_9ACTN|nr:PH domain-containing protein [Gordonia oryzae]
MTRSTSGARSSTQSSSDSARSAPAESTTASPSEAMSDKAELPQEFTLSKLAYFTVPATLLVVLILAGTNLAWFGWTFAVPVLLAVWIRRIKTVVTEDGLRAVGTFGSRDVEWPDIDGLQFSRWGPARAVLTDGDRVRLPAITFGDMPRLSAASAGRIPDPFAAARDAR